MDSWAAWWTGDIQRLRQLAPVTAPNGYWASRARDCDRLAFHLPAAGDIARRSARLVASDTPALDWGNTTSAAEWDTLSQTIGWSSSILELVQTSSAVGLAYSRPMWDQAFTGHPLLTVVSGNDVLPTWRWGQLVSATVVTELKDTADEVLRWLEHHEDGQIRHELWLGTKASIGRLVPLTEHPVTADLKPIVNTTPVRPRGILMDPVPCLLPNPLAGTNPVGRPHIQGSEVLLDQLDFSWDSLMRELRLGRKRIMVAQEYLTPIGRDGDRVGGSRWSSFFSRPGGSRAAAGFDTDDEVYSSLPGLDTESQTDRTPGITPVDMVLRTREHLDACAALFEQTVSRAGFAPQTFGISVEGQLSGTAIRRREHASYGTRDEQRRYARPGLERTAETLMLINKVVFGRGGDIERPTLSWVETQQTDPMETAQTIELLRRAEAISDDTAVRTAHPEWDDEQIGQELAKLADERAARNAVRTAPALTGFETPPGTNPDPEDEQP